MEKQLKPCPFCGGEANIYQMHFWGTTYTCECSDCGIETKPMDTEAEAIEAWNRRTETASDTLMRVLAYDATCGVCDKRKERTAKVDWMDGDPYCDCGQELRNGFVYCPGCGAKLEWGGNERN